MQTFNELIRHNQRATIALVVALALFLGLLGGLIAFFCTDTYSGEPDSGAVIYGVLIGFSLAIWGSLISYYCGAMVVMGIADGHRVEREDDLLLHNVTSEMALAAGIPMPSIFIIPDPAPNAMATGRDPEHALVAITTGLRTKLKRDELQAVIAHEIAHIKNSDTGLMMMVAVYAGLIVWVSDLGERLFLQKNCPGGRHQGGRSRGSGSALQLILFVVTLCLIWLAPIISKLLQLAISRQREYLADAAAVKYCRNPGALAEALKKISLDTDTPSRKNRALEHLYIINPDPKLRLERPDWDSLWSTHPPLIERIKRLRALEGQ